MAEYVIGFSSLSSEEEGSYRLLELPPELASLVETAIARSESLSLTVKGHPSEDAVLCSDDKTYTMRTVVLSNSVLIVSSGDGDSTVAIRDQVNEVIELTPTVPKLHKLSSLLRGREYDESQDDLQNAFSYEDARIHIQASDKELNSSLKEKRILNLNGILRPVAPRYLSNVLELLLNLLISLSQRHSEASVDDLSSVLADEHEVPSDVSTQIMSWFGEIAGDKWKMDVEAVMKEMGLSVLRDYKHEPIRKEDLMSKWKAVVGDSFESNVSLNLLAGNYLSSFSHMSDEELLTYFPASSLPAEPAARFSDLFLTRPRWKSEDIIPFLSDIAVNSKERDKLLLRYCRAITDSQGIWYTARAQYNG